MAGVYRNKNLFRVSRHRRKWVGTRSPVAYSDSDVVGSVTSPSADETRERTDTSVVGSVTSLSSTEAVGYTDPVATVNTQTSTLGTVTKSTILTSSDYIVQSFIAGSSGQVIPVTIQINNLATATGFLEISLWTDGSGGLGTQLGAQNFDITTFVSGTQTITANLASIPVVSGTLYWIAVRLISFSGTGFIGWNQSTTDLVPGDSAETFGLSGANLAFSFGPNPEDYTYSLSILVPALIPTTTTTPSGTDVYAPGTFQYTDAAIVTSISSPSSVDTAQDVDSSTVDSVTAPSAAETAQRVDAGTISSTTTPVAIELKTTATADSDTVSSTTTPSAVDVADYADTSTIASVTTVSAVESSTATYLDTGTVASVTQPSTTDITAFVESATIVSTTVFTPDEVHEIPDSATVNGVTTVISVTGAAIISRRSSVASGNSGTGTGTTFNVTVGGDWAVGDVVILFVDATDNALATAPTITAAGWTQWGTGVSSYARGSVYFRTVQSGDTSYTITLDRASVYAYAAAAYAGAALPVAGTKILFKGTPNSTLTCVTDSLGAANTTDWCISGFFDRTTTTTLKTTSWVPNSPSTEVAEVNNSTKASAPWISATLDDDGTTIGTLATTTRTNVRSGGVTANTNWQGFIAFIAAAPGGGDTAQLVDGTTIQSSTTVSAVEVATGATIDAGTISSITNLSTIEIAQYTEIGTVPSVTSPTATEVTAYVDASTISIVTVPSSLELHEIPDSNTVSNTTTVSTLDTAQYVESNTVSSKTVFSATEIFSSAVADASSISSITTVSAVETVQYVDSSTVASSTFLSSQDIVAYADATTVTGTTVLSSSDVAAFVESNIVSGKTTPSSTEATALTDSNTISSTTAPSATDVAAYVDNATVSSVTIASVDEQTSGSFTDASTLKTTTTLVAVETVAYIESATISSTTTPVANEQKITVTADSATFSSITNPSATEVAVYIDSATIANVTTPSAADVVVFTDASAFSSKTTLSGTEARESFDNNTWSTTTVPTSVDVSTYADSSTVAGVTDVEYTEEVNKLYSDSALVISYTYPSGTDAAISGFEDAAAITSRTTAFAVEYVFRTTDLFALTWKAYRKYTFESSTAYKATALNTRYTSESFTAYRVKTSIKRYDHDIVA